jgi:hypothetical protein
MAIVLTGKHERSFAGHLVKRLFIAFNLFMIVWIFGGLHWVSKLQTHSDVEKVGSIIGTTIGVTLLLILWGVGDLILGILVLLTRGNKIIIEESSSTFQARSLSAADEGSAFDLERVDQRIAELKAVGAPSPRRPMASPSSQGFGKRRA